MKIKKILTLNNIIIVITFCLILISGIYTNQKVFYMIPLCISLLVMAIQAEINRFGYFLGCINACIYAAAYFSMGIYASALSALCFSFPIQLMTLLMWRKKSYGKGTLFKKMSIKMLIFFILCLIFLFCIFQYLLTLYGSNYAILDNAASLCGVVTSILCMFTYIEYAYLGFIHVIFTVALNIQVTLQNTAHITYLINSVYAIYCATVTLINVRRIYKEQNKNKSDLIN